ncbi:type I polyketide synthase [Umezakia ovalisporum]|uniref:type I polyketide synthase n=1 Tax=Umezakia ovalisporum TaxID=75695 RepID=UPI0024742F58|nr:type I polyketide synthase [Umezakia ovalisporum]MDH6083544.1 acyltransferase domain-containing protein [Umezakia ovalisporum TAC611]
MSAYSIDTALSELESLVNSVEKTLIRSIEEKKLHKEKPMSVNKINRKLAQNPIAIVGMASLLPQARNLREYWQNIVDKIDCITDVPATHWSVEDYYDPNPRTPEDKTYCKRGGFIPEVDFNPMEFGIPPSILEVTDISQLLGLVIAKEAMEDAGYGESREFCREKVGVILGVAMAKQLGMPLSARLEYPVWEKVLKSSGISHQDTQKIIEKIKSAYIKWDENAFPGMLANVVAGRIANRLNFGGTNCVVDAACASSFGALKMAISELVEYRADMMLTGGVDTDNTIMAYISFSKTPAVSPSENVKAFDAKSDGMLLGEGVGMVVLKRLEDAERDNDKIYAVIKGIGTSSDGRYKSIYAPRKEGQVKALERAYDDAGFSPATVGLVEAHGTGTMAGDPTEFGSLKEYFSKHDSQRQHIALGSVKSQIGHTKAAAGAASLIKTALALHHKVLPPTINITEPNPKLDIKNSSFYLNTETRPWIRAEGDAPRRAGVSSFGFGGTNYHVVLEEYETPENLPYRLHGSAREVLLYASNPAHLLTKCEETLGKLQSNDGSTHFASLVKECQSMEIPAVAARVGFVAENLQEACKLMQVTIDWLKQKASVTSWEHPQGIYYRSSGIDLGGKVVSLFSGQGSQYLEMGREVVMNFPIMRRLHGCMDSLLLKDNLQPLSEIVFPRPVFDEAEKNAQIAALQRTEYAQSAIGVFSAGLYSILQQAGFKSDFVAGHSFGELTALWAAGVLNEQDYLFLVKSRGQAMAAPEDPDHDAGSMLAVKEDMSKVAMVLRSFPQVTIANFNSPTQIVLAGPTGEIDKVKQALHNQGCTAVLLPVSAAFHTPLIAFAQKSFAIAIKSVKFNSPKISVFTNVTGKPYPQEPQVIQKILETHLSSSVMFKQEIENIYGAGGYCFVDFGPRRILTNLVKDILGDRPHFTISLNPSTHKDSDRSLREGAVQLRVLGVALKNLDPYQVELAPPPGSKNALNVRLKGINYVSEKTKNAFTQALQNGHKVSLPVTPTVEFSEVAVTTPPVKELSTNGLVTRTTDSFPELSHNSNDFAPQPQMNPVIPTAIAQEVKMQPTPEKPVNFDRALESLEYLLTQFQQNQTDNLQVHGTYLQHQMEYTKAFFQLMQQQNALFANNKSYPEGSQLQLVVHQSLERGMMQFHSQQGETLRIHEQYLLEQLEYAKNFFQLIQQEYSQIISSQVTTQPRETVVIKTAPDPVVAAPSNPCAPHIDLTDLGKNLLAITSDKTGYPIEMLEMDMDMEADLGIDSIKRVEILGALQDIYPDLPKPNLEELSEKRTIGEVVEYLQSCVSGSTSMTTQEVMLESIQSPLPLILPGGNDIPNPVETTNLVVSTPPVTEEEIATADNYADLGQTLLSITSDKTGYPVEMLEMDMDMEADLGIDSIKRVEILGAIQDKYPHLPQPNLEELGDLRTIGQIVDYLQKLGGGEKKKSQSKFSHQPVQVIDGVARRPAKLQFLPPPDSLDFALPQGHVTLITDDGSLTTSQLAEALRDGGAKVVVLSFPPSLVPQQSPLPAKVNRVVLADMTEELLQHKLSAIATHFGTIGAFIHIHPVFSTHQIPAYLPQEKEIVKHLFFMAKHLKQSLNQVARYQRSCFLTVNRLDGAFGLEHNINFGAIGPGLLGLTKSLKWEWPKVFTRAIDLSPALNAQQSAEYIIAELYDPNLYISEVAYGSQGRVTLVGDFQN